LPLYRKWSMLTSQVRIRIRISTIQIRRHNPARLGPYPHHGPHLMVFRITVRRSSHSLDTPLWYCELRRVFRGWGAPEYKSLLQILPLPLCTAGNCDHDAGNSHRTFYKHARFIYFRDTFAESSSTILKDKALCLAPLILPTAFTASLNQRRWW